jgi:DNA-binding MarR family transcriptional regulator
LINEISVEGVASRLRLVMQRMVRRIKRETEAGHSPSAISTLATVARLSAPTLGEVAEAEGVSRPSVTVQVAALEAQGLLRREPDVVDRRSVKVRLTARGSRVLELSRSRRDSYFARRLAGLSRAELATLDEAATILERLLEERA